MVVGKGIKILRAPDHLHEGEDRETGIYYVGGRQFRVQRIYPVLPGVSAYWNVEILENGTYADVGANTLYKFLE
jgi:hypothetical protein